MMDSLPALLRQLASIHPGGPKRTQLAAGNRNHHSRPSCSISGAYHTGNLEAAVTSVYSLYIYDRSEIYIYIYKRYCQLLYNLTS